MARTKTTPPHMKLVINAGSAEDWIGRCIESVRRQSHRDWEAFVTIDQSGDRTDERAIGAIGSDARFTVRVNPRPLYSTANLVRAIQDSKAEAEDVVVGLDGDDWFYLTSALEVIGAAYATSGCWMTYGSWIPDMHAHLAPEDLPEPRAEDPWPKEFGRWPAYEEGEENFRAARWLATQVRTWKKWLWDRLDDGMLRDSRGEYFRAAGDCAVMFPMLEMCGTEKARHIKEPLMVYNRSNPNSIDKIRTVERKRNTVYLRQQNPFARIPRRADSTPAGRSARERG